MRGDIINKYHNDIKTRGLIDSMRAMLNDRSYRDIDLIGMAIFASILNVRDERSKIENRGKLESLFKKEKKLEALLELNELIGEIK